MDGHRIVRVRVVRTPRAPALDQRVPSRNDDDDRA
jgi:hypothetical protein